MTKRCLLWHSWEVVKTTGVTDYLECSDCGKRKIVQGDGGCYQPVDHAWLLSELVEESNPPKIEEKTMEKQKHIDLLGLKVEDAEEITEEELFRELGRRVKVVKGVF